MSNQESSEKSDESQLVGEVEQESVDFKKDGQGQETSLTAPALPIQGEDEAAQPCNIPLHHLPFNYHDDLPDPTYFIDPDSRSGTSSSSGEPLFFPLDLGPRRDNNNPSRPSSQASSSELSDNDDYPFPPYSPKSDPDLAAFVARLTALNMALEQPVNELLSTQKSSDGLQIALHPLPLLEISDHITRSYQRGHKGALVGALLGQQNGRQITIEYSFTFGATKGEDGFYHTDPESFIARLDQMRDVHKDPPLDIVGWYTLVPKTGPVADHLPIHNEILERYNESAILLGFHIEDALSPIPGNPLPITIYESNHEAEDRSKDVEGEEDQQMKDSETKMVLRFRELPYTTETGEAEMIAMQYIREGAAHATKREGGGKPAPKTATTTTKADKKGKGKGKQPASSPAASGPAAQVDEDANLTKDELEQISALQAKANAIKMMRDRIGLLIAYLQKLDPAYLDGTLTGTSTYPADGSGEYLPPSQNILRQIQALVTNIELVTPAKQEELEKEMLQETNDVKLISLLKDMFSSVSDMRDVGKKFAVVESNRKGKNRRADPGLDHGASSLVGDLHTQ